MCVCAPQYRLLSRPTPTARPRARLLQKERSQSFKVRPRTAIARAPSLTARVHTPSAKPHVLKVRLMPCAAQAIGHNGWARVAGVWHAHTAAVARVWSQGDRSGVVHVRPPPRYACGSVARRGRGRVAWRWPRRLPRELRRPACLLGVLCRATMALVGRGWVLGVVGSVQDESIGIVRVLGTFEYRDTHVFSASVMEKPYSRVMSALGPSKLCVRSLWDSW